MAPNARLRWFPAAVRGTITLKVRRLACGEMHEDEVDLTDETVDLTAESLELTAEQMVAADTAMLLDLGEAEALADRIAAQSLRCGDGVSDRKPDQAASPPT